MIRKRVHRVIYASDFSDASAPAFVKAVELAKTYRAELLLLHVLSVIRPVFGKRYIAPRIFDAIEADARQAVQSELDGLAAKARKAGVRAKSLVVVGDPDEEILRAARRHRAGLLVMGTHGRTGVTKALLGSVAERVLARSTCPVMTVRGR